MSIYQDVFFSATDILRGRKTISRLKFLRRSQHWSRDRLLTWQLDRLNELLSQAATNSPFYGARLAAIRRPFRDLAEIEQIPILAKEDVRQNPEGIRTRNVPSSRFIESRTGGSTGEPLTFLWDKRGRDWNRASVYRSAEWAGVALGAKAVQMSSARVYQTSRQRSVTRLTHSLQRYKDLPMGAVSEELLETHWSEIVDYRPTSIWGYASAIDLLAEYVESREQDADREVVRALLTSSETLRSAQRARINRAFGPNKVFDQYGSKEFYLGAECAAHDGYHLHSEVLLVEIVDHNNRAVPPGQTGRVLVTDLSNHAFPFVRYEIGDLGVMAEDTECACGVRLPRLQSVEGRISDVVVLRDRVLTAPSFTGFFHGPGIRAFQIRQEVPDHLKIVVVPDEGFTKEVAISVMGGIADLVGEGVQLELVETETIDVPASGKRRFVVSEVSAGHF